MDSEKAISIEGTIMSVLPGTMFRVALANDHLVARAHLRKDAQTFYSPDRGRSREDADVALRYRQRTDCLPALTWLGDFISTHRDDRNRRPAPI